MNQSSSEIKLHLMVGIEITVRPPNIYDASHIKFLLLEIIKIIGYIKDKVKVVQFYTKNHHSYDL